MSTEENKAICRRVPEEMFNRGNLAVADQLFTADYREHAPLLPDFPPGVEGVKRFVTMLRAAFPDFRYTIDDIIAEGDRVVLRTTARGTHQGSFFGIPPTGRQATWTEIHIARMAGGKIAEHWVNTDQLGLMQQLGVIPAPGPQTQPPAYGQPPQA